MIKLRAKRCAEDRGLKVVTAEVDFSLRPLLEKEVREREKWRRRGIEAHDCYEVTVAEKEDADRINRVEREREKEGGENM